MIDPVSSDPLNFENMTRRASLKLAFPELCSPAGNGRVSVTTLASSSSLLANPTCEALVRDLEYIAEVARSPA